VRSLLQCLNFVVSLFGAVRANLPAQLVCYNHSDTEHEQSPRMNDDP